MTTTNTTSPATSENDLISDKTSPFILEYTSIADTAWQRGQMLKYLFDHAAQEHNRSSTLEYFNCIAMITMPRSDLYEALSEYQGKHAELTVIITARKAIEDQYPEGVRHAIPSVYSCFLDLTTSILEIMADCNKLVVTMAKLAAKIVAFEKENVEFLQSADERYVRLVTETAVAEAPPPYAGRDDSGRTA